MTAENARDALNKLIQVKAHVVICDVHLGDSDALWLIREVRKLKATTPFIRSRSSAGEDGRGERI